MPMTKCKICVGSVVVADRHGKVIASAWSRGEDSAFRETSEMCPRFHFLYCLHLAKNSYLCRRTVAFNRRCGTRSQEPSDLSFQMH